MAHSTTMHPPAPDHGNPGHGNPGHGNPDSASHSVVRGAAALAVVGAAGLSLAVLAGCGTGDTPLPPVTVTVAAPDTGTPATPPPGTPSSVPTVAATPTGPVVTVPVQLSAGAPVGAPRDFARAQARLAKATADPAVRGVFRSPTGNLFCDIRPSARPPACEVARGRVPPPPPVACTPAGPKDVGRVELTRQGAVPVCTSDTIRDPAAPVLRYGLRTVVPGSPLTCLSETTGVTCVDTASRHGLFLTRGGFATF